MSRETRQLERVAKGFANHRRIDIMRLLDKEPELSVFDITYKLDVNFRTVSDHIKRLTAAGLVMKRNEGTYVRHALTPLGKSTLRFLNTLG